MRTPVESRRLLAIAIALASTIALAIVVVPPIVLRDVPPPVSLTPFIAGARATLRSEAIEGPFFWWPAHLRFVDARCSVMHHGRVALVFEEWRPPYLETTYAVAMRGSMPSASDDSWSGGLGMRSVYDDDEFVHQMGTDTVRCS